MGAKRVELDLGFRRLAGTALQVIQLAFGSGAVQGTFASRQHRLGARESVPDKRRQLLSFLLRHSRIYTGGGHWTLAHRRWLARRAFEHPAQQIVFQEGVDAIEDAARRLRRMEEPLATIVPTWSLAPVVEATRRCGVPHSWSP